MNIFYVLFFLILTIETTISYREYSASRMPDYDLDYDNMRESKRGPNYSTQKLLNADDDEDYQYNDEDDKSKPPKQLYVDETIPNIPNGPKAIKEDIDTDFYNEDKFEQRNRRRKIFNRKNTDFDSIESNRKFKFSHNRHAKDDVPDEDYPLKEDDYKESYEKESKNYNSRESVTRKVRRKPRDRPIKVNLPNNELIQSSNEENGRQNIRRDKLQEGSFKEDLAKKILVEAFDDMKRVNNFKENLPLIIRQPVNLTEFASPSYLGVMPYRRADTIDETTRVSLIVSKTTPNIYNITLKMATKNNSELSLAERSRLSILKKVLRKENSNITKTTKPPVLMQVTNNMQTVVLVESNNLENEIKKVRRVMDDNPEVMDKAKHLMRQKLVADAKSIEDLTNNWDEMICDYIDLNLLNSSSTKTTFNLCWCCLKFIVFVMFNF